jgi:hypothetical protein
MRSYTSYTAGLMIAYGASQKAVHGLAFTDDMELIDKCVRVLSYCALKDAMAGKFRDALNRQIDHLQRVPIPRSESPDRNTTGQPSFSEILFDFGFDLGSSQPHCRARNLLDLIRRPFSGLGKVFTPATMSNRAETTMGTHLEWEWELKNCKNSSDLMEIDAPDSRRNETGSMVSSVVLEPQGAAWTTWTPTTRV